MKGLINGEIIIRGEILGVNRAQHALPRITHKQHMRRTDSTNFHSGTNKLFPDIIRDAEEGFSTFTIDVTFSLKVYLNGLKQNSSSKDFRLGCLSLLHIFYTLIRLLRRK